MIFSDESIESSIDTSEQSFKSVDKSIATNKTGLYNNQDLQDTTKDRLLVRENSLEQQDQMDYCPERMMKNKNLLLKSISSRKRELVKTKKRERTVFTDFQVQELENIFKKEKYPDFDCKSRLSKVLNLSETKVQIWFKNRRAKLKRQRSDEINNDCYKFEHHYKISESESYQQHGDKLLPQCSSSSTAEQFTLEMDERNLKSNVEHCCAEERSPENCYGYSSPYLDLNFNSNSVNKYRVHDETISSIMCKDYVTQKAVSISNQPSCQSGMYKAYYPRTRDDISHQFGSRMDQQKIYRKPYYENLPHNRIYESSSLGLKVECYNRPTTVYTYGNDLSGRYYVQESDKNFNAQEWPQCQLKRSISASNATNYGDHNTRQYFSRIQQVNNLISYPSDPSGEALEQTISLPNEQRFKVKLSQDQLPNLTFNQSIWEDGFKSEIDESTNVSSMCI